MWGRGIREMHFIASKNNIRFPWTSFVVGQVLAKNNNENSESLSYKENVLPVFITDNLSLSLGSE